MLNLETLLRTPDVDTGCGFSLSRDGRHIAFAWNKTGQWQIYELDLKDSSPATALSSGPGGKVCPRYSPDGRFLAWMLDFDGSENYHIFLHERTTGKTRDLTPNITFAIQPFCSWSPDGKHIAYLADKSGNFDLYLHTLDGSEDRLLFCPGGPAHFVRWSPAGNNIAVTAEKEWQTDGTFVVPLDGSLVQRVGSEAEPIDSGQPAFSPDGTKLAFTSNSSGWSQIGIYNLTDDRIQWLTIDNGDKYYPAWSPDGKRLAWIYNNAETAWVEIRAEDGTIRRIQTEPGFANWPKFSRDGKSIIFIYENPHQPTDIWQTSPNDESLIQLTESLPADLRSAEFVIPKAITFPGLDGTPIPGMLYVPKEASHCSPGVVLIHGGPSFHLGYYWHPFIAHLASRGWTVIAPNYRGSTGYGREWTVSNRFELGRLDSDDCAAAAIHLANSGLADPSKIAVTGRSHGGYLTLTCMTRNPELFAAGSAVVPFINWFTGHKNSREDLQYWDIQNMGDPVENHELWYQRSPFFFLDRVRAPVQFICGENDARCPPSESIAAYSKLVELGVTSELLLYKEEGHGFLELKNIIESENKRVEFLANILENPSPTSPNP